MAGVGLIGLECGGVERNYFLALGSLAGCSASAIWSGVTNDSMKSSTHIEQDRTRPRVRGRGREREIQFAGTETTKPRVSILSEGHGGGRIVSMQEESVSVAVRRIARTKSRR